MRVIIVEDEKTATENMLDMIRVVDAGISVLACLESVQETISWLNDNASPDLGFFDIQLADGLCFEIFEQIDLNFPVVFTTAYSEYALKAFKVNSIDYLLKPIKQADLEFALNKYKNLRSQYLPKASKEILAAIKNVFPEREVQYKKSILIQKHDGFIPLRTEDIACFYIDQGIVYCQLFDNKTYAVHETLDTLEEKLNPERFYRINRQTIIAKDAIQEVSNYFKGKLLIKSNIERKIKLLISKGRVAEFRKWIQE